MLDAVATAQVTSSAYGIVVREHGLSRLVHSTPSKRIVIRHPAGSPNPDLNVRRDVLRYALYTPAGCSIRITVVPQQIRSCVRVERVGSYDGRQVSHLIVDPHYRDSTGASITVDSFAVALSWDVPLVRAEASMPPGSQAFLNSAWGERIIPAKKRVEQPEGNVEPSRWYDRSASYMRLHTRKDGIAYVMGSEILRDRQSVPFEDVALYWRGAEQPIYIDDVDASNTVTAQDRVLFRGRRAAGDTLWHDLFDTVGVFYLTTKARPAERQRLSAMRFAALGFDTLRSVVVREHIELDSGYFHPGSGIDDDHSIFETSDVFLEGFYWKSLYGRSREHARFALQYTPADSGEVRIVADLATTTQNPRYDPEHILSVWFPARVEPEVSQVDGYQAVQTSWSAPSSTLPSGKQEVVIEATGSDELRANTDWYSEILVNGFDVVGDARPLLDKGLLRCTVDVVDSAVVNIENVRTGPLYLLDTAMSTIGEVRAHKPGVTVRSGLWPRIIPGKQWDGSSYNGSVTLGSSQIELDSMRPGMTILHRQTLGESVRVERDLSMQQAAVVLRSIPRNALVIVLNAGANISPDVSSELAGRGLPEDSLRRSNVWMAFANNGVTRFTSRAGLTVHMPDLQGTDGAVAVALPRGRHHLFVSDSLGLEHASVLEAKNQGVSNDSTFGDIIAIAHRTHLQEASRWASHRVAQSGKKVSLFDVEAIFEEYDAGRHSPHAIRAFLKDVFSKAAKKPTHCVLIGNASWDVRQAIKQGNVSARRIDQVPTYGRPSSDMWFGLLDDERDLAVPELIVTRFPVTTSAECRSLVDKIIATDTQTYTPNLRKFLFVGGGTAEENFCEMYQRMLDDTFGSEIVFTEPPLCLDTVTVCNTDYDAPGLQIRQKINSGVAWMNYIGHGGTDVFDIKDWDPQDLNNSNKYPVLATFSCLTGNFASPSSLCENASYLVEPQKGVVAAMGATGYQYLPVVDLLHFRFHEAMRSKGLRAIGDLTYEAKRAFSTMTNQLGRNAALQYCILGDPFTRLRIDTTSDLQVYSNNISVHDIAGQPEIFIQQDSMYVNVEVWNAGVATALPVELVVRRFLPGSSIAHDSVVITVAEGLCSTQTVVVALGTQVLGEHRIEVQIDPKKYTSDDPANNTATVYVLVQNRSLQIIDPLPYGTVDVLKPQFRLLYPYLRLDRSDEPVTASVHASYNDALIGRAPRFNESSRIDSGSYVDVIFRPTALEISSVDTNSVFWLRASSSRSDAVIQPFILRKGTAEPEEHTVYAKGLAVSNDSVDYDSTTVTLRLATRSVPIRIISRASLSSDPVRQPSLRIAYGDTVLQSSFRNGLNIVVVRPFATTPRVIRRYDTSPTPAPLETGHSGGAREFLAFLKDSVSDHEVVAIAACNESFTQFDRSGLLQELRGILRTYGSALSDSIAVGAAYALVGSKDRRRNVYESVRGPMQSAPASIDTVLSIRYARARIAEIDVVRPGVLKSISATMDGLIANTVTLRGYAGEPVTEVFADSWVAPRNSRTLQRATVELLLTASDQQPDPSFAFASIYYEPAPMLYVDSSMVYIPVQEALRGDSVEVNVSVRNLQYRFRAPEAVVSTVVQAPGDTLRQQTTATSITSISPDGTADLTVRAYNDPDWPRIAVRTSIDQPGEEKSLVRLFQRAQMQYQPREDSSAPSISVFAHQRPLVTGDYVDSMPRLTIQLRDAAKLPIRSDDNFVVFLNGVRIRSNSVKDYAFSGTQECETAYPGTDIRAEVSFTYPADVGENLLIARVTDASGNKDTAEIYFWYQSQDQIRDVRVSPNPTSGNATFSISMAGNGRTYPAQLAIHDVQGRIVAERAFMLYTGTTTVSWDGESMYGSDLSPGVYFWSIAVPSTPQVPVENRTSGIITILR